MSIKHEEPLEDCPAWAVTCLSLDEESVCIAIRSCHKLFYLEVFANNLEGWSGREQFLLLLQDAVDDNDAEESLYDLIWEQFQPFIDTLAIQPPQNSTSLSLQDFYGVSILPFKLVCNGTDIHFIRLPEDSALITKLLPQTKLSDIVNAAKVLHIDASQTRIRPYFSEGSDISSDTPVKVSLGDSPKVYYFKAVQDHPSFLREFEALRQLAEHRLNEKSNLPTLHSLVTYSTSPDTIMGILLYYIDHDSSMIEWMTRRDPSQQLREKWYQQIKDTTRALH
ncbi:hypothetical protein H2198_003926 [Neophaeococcomyces mojaviensis]|uniref:Uncharacterized protein n=1 Tax=Neophaeococcomyces mojaviensis TaxID=3383035 RepID=A0ACC3AA02_9EURO|nr:hypothetical protein H2198_003926 [Knufia sp. JES_112]